jgi:uncharacterized protein YjbI with pentapeptide repeats
MYGLREPVDQAGEASLPEVRSLSRRWSLAVLLLLGLTVACVVAFVVPPLVVRIHDVPDPVKRLELQNAVRTTLLSGMAVIFFLTTAYYTARQLQTARDQLVVSQEQLRISERGQVTERLTRAIDQLASTSRPAQVGAIYALERIAQDHEELRSTFVEIVCAYVREHAPCTPQRRASRMRQRRLRVDLQVALTVLSRAPWLAQWRREDAFEQVVDSEIVVTHSALNLADTDLRFAVLPKAELDGANLTGANLQLANLESAGLDGASLGRADFRRANLTKARFRKANLHQANFRRATLEGADFTDAATGGNCFDYCKLSRARFDCHTDSMSFRGAELYDVEWGRTGGFSWVSFREAHAIQVNFEKLHFNFSDLRDALFWDANFQRAELAACDLRGAQFMNADLRRAKIANCQLDGADFGLAELQGGLLYNLTVPPEVVKTLIVGQVYVSETVTWPNGFDPFEHGAIHYEKWLDSGAREAWFRNAERLIGELSPPDSPPDGE